MKKEEFENNKEYLAIVAQEDVFKNLSDNEQKKLITEGLFDENGKRIVSKIYPCTPKDENSHINTDYQVISVSEGSWENVYIKKPLIQTTWGQSGGYNDKITLYCDEYYYDQAPVGCVAVAVGQIMGYYKKPLIFKNRTMNWEDMTKPHQGDMFSNIYNRNAVATENIQHLLTRLGDADLLNMNYDCRGSSVSNENTLKTFAKLGYVAHLEEYNSNKIISEIKNDNPVYISGCSFKYTHTSGWWIFKKKWHTYSDCHAWIVDGYVKKKRETTKISYNECFHKELIHKYSTYIELIHNNFGWGENVSGKKEYKNQKVYRGWYKKDLFNANIGPNDPSITYSKFGEKYNFQYKNSIIITKINKL